MIGDYVGRLLTEVLPLLKRLWVTHNLRTLFPAPRVHKHPLTRESEASSQWGKLGSIPDSLPKDPYAPLYLGAPPHDRDLHNSQIITAKDATCRLYTPQQHVRLHRAAHNSQGQRSEHCRHHLWAWNGGDRRSRAIPRQPQGDALIPERIRSSHPVIRAHCAEGQGGLRGTSSTGWNERLKC